MNSSESVSKIAGAIAKAQAEFKSVQKGGENTFDRYSYAKLEDYIVAVRPVLAKYGLAILSSVDEVVALDERKTANGKAEHAVRVKLSIRVFHESGEWVESSAWGEGQDRGDKAVYKAITGARKYGVASALGLATTDDPEGDNDTENHSPEVAPRSAAKPQPVKPVQHDELFRATLDKAFQDRKFQPEEADAAIKDVMEKFHLVALEELPVEKRSAFIAHVEKGGCDKFKLNGKVPANA